MADNDRVNGEALTNHGRDPTGASGSDDWRRSGDRDARAEAGVGPTPVSHSGAIQAAKPAGEATSAGKVWLEVAEFKGRPEGGYALIRLHGLRTLPADATFTILPGEQRREHGVELLGWPEGEHLPVARRETAEGIELVVGPAVVESAALLPGTPVIIELAAAGVRGEILWPSVAQRRAPPPAPIVPGSLRFSHVHAPDAAVRDAAVLSGLPRRAAPEVIELSALPALPPVPAQAAADFSNLAALAASLAAQGRKPAFAASQPASTLAQEQPDGVPRDEASVPTPPEAIRQPAPAEDASAAPSPPAPAQAAPASAVDRAPPALPPSLPDREAADASAARNRSDIVVSPLRTALKPVEPPGLSLVERPSPPPPSIDRVGRGLAGIALFAAMLAAGSSLMVLHTLRGMMPTTATASTVPPTASISAQPPKGGVTPAEGARTSVASAPATQDTPAAKATTGSGLEGTAAVTKAASAAVTAKPASPAAMLFEIFSPGSVSPRGRPAADFDLDAALALADKHIHGGDASISVDLKEGEFWVRRGVSRFMADGRLRWALTQLGSVYAAPGETSPDFEKARMMWEISGALGDAVALCFLGNLHEYGLGIPVNLDVALTWYERARAAGGCKGIDEAIARVKR